MNFSFIRYIVLLYIGVMVSCNKHSTQAGYSGEDLSSQAVIKVDKNTRRPILEISYVGDWTLYSGSSVKDINLHLLSLEEMNLENMD